MAVRRAGEDIAVDGRDEGDSFSVFCLLGDDVVHKARNFRVQDIIIAAPRTDADRGRHQKLADFVSTQARAVEDSAAAVCSAGLRFGSAAAVCSCAGFSLAGGADTCRLDCKAVSGALDADNFLFKMETRSVGAGVFVRRDAEKPGIDRAHIRIVDSAGDRAGEGGFKNKCLRGSQFLNIHITETSRSLVLIFQE